MSQGKYDDICTMVLQQTGAAVALVIVMGGNRGSGFSMQIEALRESPAFINKIPDLLRDVAAGVEQQIKEGGVEVDTKFYPKKPS